MPINLFLQTLKSGSSEIDNVNRKNSINVPAIEQYIIKNVNLNFKDAVATTPHQTNGNVTGGGDGYLTGSVR